MHSHSRRGNLPRYHDRHPDRFRGSDPFEPAHILFKALRDDVVAYAKAVAQAEAVLAQLKERPDSFDSLGRSLSDRPSATEGGRLGQVVRGDTTPEFETFLVAMQPGQICPTPVRTRYGVHVLRLDRKIEGEALPFVAVQERIAAYLEERTWRRAVAQYIALLQDGRGLWWASTLQQPHRRLCNRWRQCSVTS